MRLLKLTVLMLCIVLTIAALASCGENKDPDDLPIESDSYQGDMSSYVSLPDLKEIKVYDSEVKAEWEKIALAIRLEYTDYAQLYDENAVVELYDSVNIDYSIAQESMDIVSEDLVTALSHDGEDVIVGSMTLIEAYSHPTDSSLDTRSFEDQLLGSKAGDTLQITVTFPDDYIYTDENGKETDDLASARCTFDVTVNFICRGEIPDLAANLISNYTAEMYTTVAAYRDYIYAYYRSAFAYDAILKSATLIEYPEEELYNARLNYMTSVIGSKYSSVDLDEEDVQALYDTLYDQADAYAKQAVFERLVLEYLFDKCNVELTETSYQGMLEADYRSRYYEYYMYYGVTTMVGYESYFGKENLVLQYKYQKLMDVLASYVTIVSE